MATITIRVDDDLELRIRKAAERAGRSRHGYLREAIEQSIAQNDQRLAWRGEAARRWKKILGTGETIAWHGARHYLMDRVAGRPVAPPRSEKAGGRGAPLQRIKDARRNGAS